MINIIIFSIFCFILYVIIFGGIGLYINNEKGRNKLKGFIIGFCFPIGGIVMLSFAKPSSEFLVNELYNRKIIKKEIFEKTIEIAISKDKKQKLIK